MSYSQISVRALIGFVFLVSSLSKAGGSASYLGFVSSVEEMRAVPRRLVPAVSGLVLLAEFAVWVLVAVPVHAANAAGLLTAVGLLLAFTAVIARTVRQRRGTSCRCFGASRAPLGIRHLVRNLVLALTAAAAVDMPSAGRVQPAAVVVAVALGMTIGAIAAALDLIFELIRPDSALFPSGSPDVRLDRGRHPRRPALPAQPPADRRRDQAAA
jgi:hypothetical protein